MNIYQRPQFLNKFFLVDGNKGVITDFIKTEINLPASKECIKEYGYLLNDNEVKYIYEKYIAEIESDNIELVSININKEWITTKSLEIVELVNQFHDILKDDNKIGCLGDGPIPDVQKFIDAPVAKSETAFKDFINTMNQSLVETFEQTWKKGGLNKPKSIYFYNEFKDKYPKLQRILHKIKLYRHSMHHLSLEERYKNTFFDFLREDLNGRLPYFVNNGYLILQYKIIDSLSKELRVVTRQKV